MNRKSNLSIAIIVIFSLFFNLNFVYAEDIPTTKIDCEDNHTSFANAICNDIYERTGEKFVLKNRPIGYGIHGPAYLLKGDNVDLCLKISTISVNKLQHNIYYNITGENFEPNFLKHIIYSKTPHLNFPVAGYESKNFYGLISKYNNAGTLKNLIESRQRLDQKQMATIIHDILTGLNCLHKENLVHGDLHSGNIMLENEKGKLRAYIIDFDFTDTEKSFKRKSFNLYDGTEYVLNRIFSSKTEIFSVGIFLWELIYEKAPFAGLKFNKRSKIYKGNINCSYKQIIREYSKNLSELPIHLHVMGNDSNLSPECRDLLSKLLNPNPDLRISAEEVLEHSFFDILK